MKKIFSMCLMSMAFATMSAAQPLPISPEPGTYPTYGYTIAEAAEVAYDVVPTSYKPADESVIDLEARQFDSIEIFFDSNDIRVRQGAAVKIIPVGYDYDAFETSNVKAIPSMKKILIGFAPVEEIDPDNEIYQGITYNGKYEVIIPQGTFGDEEWFNDPATGRSNEEIILTYEVVGGQDRTGTVYTLEPSSVTWTDDFKSFTLVYPEGTKMTDGAHATFDCFEAKYTQQAAFTDNGDSSFTVEFGEVPTESGTYTFVVGKGMFGDAEFVTDPESGIANKEYRKEITVDFTIENPEPFTVSPEPGSEVESLSSVILTLTPEDGYDQFEINTADDIYFTFNGERFCEAFCTTSGSKLEARVTDIVWEAGEYALVIEPYAISWATTDYSKFSDNEEQLVFNYTLAGGGNVTTDLPFSIDPAPGSAVESLEAVTFTLNFDEGYEWFDVDSYEAYFMRDGERFCGVTTEESDDYLSLIVRPTEAITEPGKYDLVFAAWTFMCSNEDNDPFYVNEDDLIFSYTVGEVVEPTELPFSVNPASGSVVETLDAVTLTLKFEEGYDWIEVEEYEASFRKDGEVVAGVQAEVSDDWMEVVLRPSEPITQPGVYELCIAPYALQCGTEEEDKYYFNEEELVFTYTIAEKAAEVVYDVVPTSYKPADEAVIDLEERQFDSIEIFFSSDNIKPRSGAAVEIIPLGYESEAFETSNLRAFSSLKKIIIGFGEAGEIDPDNEVYQGIEYNGIYEVIIPKGTFGDEDWINDPATGHSNEEIILTYEVVGGMERGGAGVEYTLEPTSVTWTEDLKSFTLTFPEGTMMVDAAYATLDNIEAKYMKYAEFVDNGDSTFTVEFDEAPTENGNYTFSVTEGSFGDAEFVADEVSGVANPEISKVIEFIFTGINTVNADNADKGVYNLFGVKVADSIDNLPAGIYIVGGKKVIVK